jgi:CheY-like chemotaxis protein
MGLEDECSQRKRFIRIAEDDEDDRMILEEVLREFAESVDFMFVENGRELMDYLSSRKSFPALSFLDINMPLMDGLDALEVIRSDPKLKNLPVMCFTTSSAGDGGRYLPSSPRP